EFAMEQIVKSIAIIFSAVAVITCGSISWANPCPAKLANVVGMHNVQTAKSNGRVLSDVELNFSSIGNICGLAPNPRDFVADRRSFEGAKTSFELRIKALRGIQFKEPVVIPLSISPEGSGAYIANGDSGQQPRIFLSLISESGLIVTMNLI